MTNLIPLPVILLQLAKALELVVRKGIPAFVFAKMTAMPPVYPVLFAHAETQVVRLVRGETFGKSFVTPVQPCQHWAIVVHLIMAETGGKPVAAGQLDQVKAIFVLFVRVLTEGKFVAFEQRYHVELIDVTLHIAETAGKPVHDEHRYQVPIRLVLFVKVLTYGKFVALQLLHA